MITANPHLPPRLARLLAGTTATPEQVVAYLQPDPRPNDYRKRKLLRELSPLMGEGVRVARDWMVSGASPVQRINTPLAKMEVLKLRPGLGAENWPAKAFSAELDALVEARAIDLINDNPHASDNIRGIWSDYKDGGWLRGVRFTGIGDFRHLCARILAWHQYSQVAVFYEMGVKPIAYQIRALIALDIWIASTPFGAP